MDSFTGIMIGIMLIGFGSSIYIGVRATQERDAFAAHCYELKLVPVDTTAGARCADLGALVK